MLESGLGRNQSKLKHQVNGAQYTTLRGCNPESFAQKSPNPTHGSGWMLQIISTLNESL